MKKYGILALCLCFLFLVMGLLPIHGESEIYDNVLRLHVVASSDSAADQALKYQVRDAVLDASEALFTGAITRDEAIRRAEGNMDILLDAAREAVSAAGRTDSVRIELGEEVYPTKSYELCCFPSGSYASLRVIIGEGQGQNWWCVLFPPMCLSAASAESAEEAFIAVGFTADQYRLITETDRPAYRARFRLLEVIEEALR